MITKIKKYKNRFMKWAKSVTKYDIEAFILITVALAVCIGWVLFVIYIMRLIMLL